MVPLIPNEDTPAAAPTARPRHLRRQQPHRARRPVDLRRRLIHMQRRGQHLMRMASTILITRPPRPRLGVPDIRLHRPQPQRAVTWTVLPVGGQQRLRLDRVAQLVPVPCASTASTSPAPSPAWRAPA